MDLKSAADELGVHYQTAYRWVRAGTLPAVKRGVAYDVAPEAVDRFRARRNAPAPPPDRTRVRSWVPQVDRLFDALVLGDEAGARHVVERLAQADYDVVELCSSLFAPALRRIGDHWARGRLSVADEHRASAMCTRLLARVAAHPRGRPRGIAVVTTAPGEAHELPGVMAAMALRSRRWRVHHLGAQVPAEQVAALVRREGAGLVVVSVTDPAVVDASAGYGEKVTASVGRKARVLVGSPGAPLSGLLDQALR